MANSLLQNLLRNSFEAHAKKSALWIRGKYYTYQDIETYICEVVSLFEKNNINEKLVAIITYDCLETYASILATWFMGIGFVPLSPSFPEKRKAEIIQESGIRIILSPKNERVNEISSVVIKNRNRETRDLSNFIRLSSTDDLACMLFTSGSTGKPKGVPMTYKNIDTTLNSYLALRYGPDENSKCLQMFEFTFDMSMISYLPAFLSGACVYSIVDDKYRFMTAFKIMDEFNINFAVFVPSTLGFMRRYFENFDFPSLKCCLVGGESFSLELAKEWAGCAKNARIINISGPTETTMACMGYEVDSTFKENKHLNGILAFGKPWKNTKAIVVNENLDLLPANEKGELCFSGDHVMKGYWNKQEKNNKCFFKKSIQGKEYNFYRTGDGAFMDEEGDFFTCGRIDMQVKIQGYRVEPGEIEAVVMQETGNILLAAVPYLKHADFCAIRLFIEDRAVDTEKLMTFLQESLPAYMIPDEITVLKQMPLNINGKIDRNYLKRILENAK